MARLNQGRIVCARKILEEISIGKSYHTIADNCL
jgi:hypothetical protein